MGICRYLAMTRSEQESFSLPEGYDRAYMACHFSPYSTGLSNIPGYLPENSMLMVNDRTPFHGHDPQRIAEQLLAAYEQLDFCCLLLDLERQDPDYPKLCQSIAERLPCPVGISHTYGGELPCAVFLPPVPMDMTLRDYLAPWQEREIWLDIAAQTVRVSVTEEGSRFSPMAASSPPRNAFFDEETRCHYRSEILDDRIDFYLWRDLESLIEEANTLGVARCIGLYQELYMDK